jgi:hypothetical protein
MALRLRLLVAPALFAFASLPSVGAAEVRDCNTLANSVRAEPAWYLAECLGGVQPPSAPVRHSGPRVDGDTEYILNLRAAGSFPQQVLTAPLPTLDYATVGPQTRAIFGMDFDLTATTLWGIDNASRELGTLNLATGAFTPTVVVTGLTVGSTVTGMKFDPTSATVYISESIGASSNLLTLNLATGVATPVGVIGAWLVIDIAISNAGQMYGIEIGTDSLLSIDKSTGAGALIGPVGVALNFAQGMDFDPSTDTLWAWLYSGGGVNQLASINLATGAALTADNGVNEENEGAIQVPAVIEAASPFALEVDSAFNHVLEPNETASIEPSWTNDGNLTMGLTGAASDFTGPAGPTYTIVDASADYGDIAPGAAESCVDCYFFNVAAATRPLLHWDATFLETVEPTSTPKVWTLHIGQSFADVPVADPFYRFVETILHNQITAGGFCGGFCPEESTLRKQMAVFVLKAVEGSGYAPPPATGVFNDVPISDPFAPWIEELFNRDVVAGCAAPGGPNYCPDDPVLRQQMAVFLLKTLNGSAYVPPECNGIFDDVPCPSLFADWVEDLALQGITSGCQAVPPLYCPTDPVKRKQMAVFLTNTFQLLLYGP